jgi:thioredoxin 1
MRTFRLLACIVFLFSVTACSSSGGTNTPAVGNEQSEIITPEVQASAYPANEQTANEEPVTPYPGADVIPTAVDNGSSGAYPAGAPMITQESGTNAAPTTESVSVALKATDPTTFQLASEGYQLVEFFAFWCPTCKSMAPILHRLENKYAGKVRFVFLDIDDPRTNEFKQMLGYQYQPHIFLLDSGGNIVKQWVGFVSEDELDGALSALQ